MERPDWLRWADALQTIASAGLTYSRDPFDRDRFQQVREVAAELLARHTDLSLPAAAPRRGAGLRDAQGRRPGGGVRRRRQGAPGAGGGGRRLVPARRLGRRRRE